MKRLVTIGVILAGILGLSLWGLRYARGLRDEFAAGTLRGQEACRREDAAALAEEMDTLQGIWEEREGFLSFYVSHEELERLETGLVSLSAYTASGSFRKAYAVLEQLRFQADHIYQRELPTWDNLF